MKARRLALLAAAALAALAAEPAAPAVASALGRCALSAPAVAFPSSAPDAPTGPGALVWPAAAGGCARTGGAVLEVAPLDALGRAGRPVARGLGLSAARAGAEAPAVVGAGHGEVAVLAPAGGGRRQVLLGRAGGALARVLALPGAGPVSLARAYLGDVAVGVAAGGRIRLAVLRYFSHRFGRTMSWRAGGSAVTALAVALDYRSDALVAWEQGGAIYARFVRNTGARGPVQRVAASTPAPELQAMLSDNGHGMLAWAALTAGGPARTAVSIAFTDARTRFGPVRRIAAFSDPDGLARGAGSLGLVRLADENVLLAWTAREHGRYRVRAAPAVFAGVRPGRALSPAGRDAVLEALAPGPANEVLGVWRGEGATEACTVLIGRGDVVLPCAARGVPAASPAVRLAAAVSPASDRPVLAWLDPAGRARYAAGPPLRSYRPRRYGPAAAPAPAAAPRSGGHPLRIAGAALVALALVCGALLVVRRRRRRTGTP